MRQSSPNVWQLFRQGVSLRTFLQAFIPIGLWILFIAVFAYLYRAIVHVAGPAEIAMLALRSVVELGTAAIAFKYFFDILSRGAETEHSVDSKHRT
jgi:hypothetical protein